MADKNASFRMSRVSRHTMVVRRAKEEDAKRLNAQERDDTLMPPVAGGARHTEIIRHPPSQQHVRLPGDGTEIRRHDGKRITGNTVTIERLGATTSSRRVVSGRYSGRPASVRVTGGDTIVTYKSGDLVVRRVDRRVLWRKRVILGYVGLYVAVFAVYLYYLMTGTMSIAPAEYLDRAFAKRHGKGIIELEWASMEAMRGNRTPAEVRLAEAISFHDENNETIRVEAGDRLTLLTAAKLGQAIIKDQARPEANRAFGKPLKIYRETFLTNMNWPFWLACMNCFGFFLLLGLFLYRPGRNYLGTQGKKTAVALRDARSALDRSEELRNEFRRLAREIETRGDDLRETIESQGEETKDALLAEARDRANNLEGETANVLAKEEAVIAAGLNCDVAAAACREAAEILRRRIGRAEHDAAVDELIAGIAALRPA